MSPPNLARLSRLISGERNPVLAGCEGKEGLTCLGSQASALAGRARLLVFRRGVVSAQRGPGGGNREHSRKEPCTGAHRDRGGRVDSRSEERRVGKECRSRWSP